jgi:hypothetical protein
VSEGQGEVVQDRAELLARLATEVAQAPESEDLTWRLCEATRRLLGGDGASITMDNASTNRITLAATDAVAAALENLHDVLGEGPATEAYLTGRAVVVDLPAEGDRWAVFTEAVGRIAPVAGIFALPMRSGTAVLGVLSLYRRDPGPLDRSLDQAGFLADALAAALLHDTAAASDLGAGGSWSNRSEIHQATGMVVAQLHLSVRDALAILRAHAFALDLTLGDVAHAVVTREIDFTRGPSQ